MYSALFGLDVIGQWSVVMVVTLFSAAIITLSYHNVAFSLKSSLLQNRTVSSSIKNPPGTDRRAFFISLREQQVANTYNEAVAFAVLYNNLLFLLIVFAAGFYVFASAATVINFVLSVSLAAAATSIGTATVLIR